MTDPTRRVAIVNPASAGGRTTDSWPGVLASLADRGVTCEVRVTAGEGDAIDIARDAVAAGAREIVVLGGDGTVNEVIAGCVAQDGSCMGADDLVLSIIHQGTGGDLVRTLGLPRDARGAVATAAEGTPRRLDVGIARYQPFDPTAPSQVRAFLNCANVGLAADVVAGVTPSRKRWSSTAAFALASLEAVAGNRPRAVRITTDEGRELELEVTEVSAANGRYMGGGMRVAPDADPADGLLDLVVIGAQGRIQLLRAFPGIYRGRHLGHPAVQVLRTAGVTIDAVDAPQGVVLDGELVGRTPARFCLLAGAVQVRVPSTATS